MKSTVKDKIKEEQIFAYTLAILALVVLIWTYFTDAIELGLVISIPLYFVVNSILKKLLFKSNNENN